MGLKDAPTNNESVPVRNRQKVIPRGRTSVSREYLSNNDNLKDARNNGHGDHGISVVLHYYYGTTFLLFWSSSKMPT